MFQLLNYIILYLLDEEDEKDDELDELYEEAEMPIEDIILRYQNNIIAKKNEKEKENPGSSKASPSSLCKLFLSIFLYKMFISVILSLFNVK